MVFGRQTTGTAERNTALRLRDEAERLGNAFPPLLVAADHVAHTIAQGLHGRRRAGVGEAFWQFRSYGPGDMTNTIDWRKSARSHRIYVREKEWEAASTVWLWVNPSQTMDFGSHLSRVTKAERAQLLALATAALLLRAGERVGAFGSGFPASASRPAMQRLAAYWASLDRTSPETGALPPRIALSRFSNIVLFSDFLLPASELGDRLGEIAARDVRGHLVQVLDPAEETLPYEGRTEFQDVGGALRLTVGRAEALRPDYHRRVMEHRDQLRELVRRLGWTMSVHHTDKSAQT